MIETHLRHQKGFNLLYSIHITDRNYQEHQNREKSGIRKLPFPSGRRNGGDTTESSEKENISKNRH